MPSKRLGEILVGSGVVTTHAWQRAAELESQGRGRALFHLVRLGSDGAALARALSGAGLPLATGQLVEGLPGDLLRLVPVEVAVGQAVLPVMLKGGDLWAALADPFDPLVLQEVATATHTRVRAMAIDPRLLARQLDLHYGARLSDGLAPPPEGLRVPPVPPPELDPVPAGMRDGQEDIELLEPAAGELTELFAAEEPQAVVPLTRKKPAAPPPGPRPSQVPTATDVPARDPRGPRIAPLTPPSAPPPPMSAPPPPPRTAAAPPPPAPPPPGDTEPMHRPAPAAAAAPPVVAPPAAVPPASAPPPPGAPPVPPPHEAVTVSAPPPPMPPAEPPPAPAPPPTAAPSQAAAPSPAAAPPPAATPPPPPAPATQAHSAVTVPEHPPRTAVTVPEHPPHSAVTVPATPARPAAPPAPGATPPSEDPADGFDPDAALAAALSSVHDAEDRDGIGRAALSFLERCFPRAALLTVRGDTIHGWMCAGRFDGAEVDELQVASHRPSVLWEVARSQRPHIGSVSDSTATEELNALLEDPPREAAIFPVAIGGRTAVLLYGDTADGTPTLTRRDLLERLASEVGDAFGTLILRKKLG